MSFKRKNLQYEGDCIKKTEVAMEEVEFALRAYRLRVPSDLLGQEHVQRAIRFPRRELDAWLRDHALPAIARLWPRARFREAVTWPQRVFGSGSNSKERQLLSDLADALKRSA